MSKNDEGKNDWAPIVLLILAAIVAFFLAPGVLVMGISKEIIGVNFDPAQMWTFAFVVSLFIFIAMKVIRKFWLNALKSYLAICVLITLVMVISHFGFKAEWPAIMLNGFLN